ncbi:MAG: cardiolipin synthase, partial [Prevotella sp.]|nr:cardiolipin synthase [Prevotella sp.]
MRKLLLLLSAILVSAYMSAQRADSLLVAQMREKGVTFSHDNNVTLLKTGHEKFDDLLRAVSLAKSSVHLEYFNFRNDSIAGLLFDILKKKASEGVEVRALYDGFGNFSNNRPLKKRHLKELRANGIEIYPYKDVVFPWLQTFFNRDHRKIVVIDGRIAYTGGMNVADYYITGTDMVGEWNDMHCRIEGTEVNSLQKIFIAMWNRVTGQNISGAKYYCSPYTDRSYFTGLKQDSSPTAGMKMVGIANREPHRTQDMMRSFYVNAINDAQDSIKIISPYFTLTPCLKKALKNALKRGVRVEIMLSEKCDIMLSPDCGFYNAHKLMKRGAEVWIYQPGFHHTKIIMVDGK